MKAGQHTQGGRFVDADEAGRRIGPGAQGKRNGFAVAGGKIPVRKKRRVDGKAGLGQGAGELRQRQRKQLQQLTPLALLACSPASLAVGLSMCRLGLLLL